MTANDFGIGSCLDGQTLGTNGHFAVAADGDAGALAENIRPPRTGWRRTQGPAVLLFGLVPGRLRRAADFAMLFHLVMVLAQLVQQRIGLGEIDDLLGGKEGGQPILPKGVAALDFALGLGSGGKAQRDAVKMKGGGQLGVSFGRMGEKETMVIDVKA